MEEHVSNSRRGKPTENIWFNDWRLYLLCHPWKLNKAKKNPQKAKPKNSAKKGCVSSAPIPFLHPCLLPFYSHILHPHPSAVSTSILSLYPAPCVCVFPTVHCSCCFPIPQPSRIQEWSILQCNMSSLRILGGGTCLIKSCSSSNQEAAQPFDLSWPS